MISDSVAAMKGSTLLITGGTGTFGAAILRSLVHAGLKEIRIFSRDEKKQDDLRREYPDSSVRFYLGDVRNTDSVRDAMVGVDYVFHAAALKQVPSCEFYPMEAIMTNAIGADNVLRAATEARVKKAVVLSTDKAAYPINAMGLTKALMEKIMVARSRVAGDATIMSGTRFGNVMASRGSVIPLFIGQILSGGSITVTDPAMTRFMMSIDTAVELVLYAFVHAKSGDLFVRKAPSVTLETLIAALQTIFETKVPVRVIGTRHGEKRYETLLTREERSTAEDRGDYFRVPSDLRTLNYELYFSTGETVLTDADDYHSHNTELLDERGMIDLLMTLVIVRDALATRQK